LEPSEAGPAALEEDAPGAVAVARLDEPPRFPMDGFVGGGLRLALVSRASTVCQRVPVVAGGGKREEFPPFSRIFPPFSGGGTACAAVPGTKPGVPNPQNGPVWAKVFFERPIGPWFTYICP